MSDLGGVPGDHALKMVQSALEGPRHTRKRIDWLNRHREKTYYHLMLLSSDWMHFMRQNFPLRAGSEEEVLEDVKCIDKEYFVRILKNIEFIRRVESKYDNGRIELFRKNMTKFEQHWWKAENFWNNEVPALKYRKDRNLKMTDANWYFHGRILVEVNQNGE